MLDLRIPSGCFFCIVGAILLVVAFTQNPRAPMTEANVDLYTGIVMLVFGTLLLGLAQRSKRAQ